MANFPSLWARGSLTSGTSVVLAPVGLGRGPKRSSCVSAPGIYRPGLEESHHLHTWGMVKNFSYTQSIIQRSFAEYFLNLSVFFLIFLNFYFNRPFLRPIGNKLVTSPSQFVQLCLVCASITALCSCAISWEREHPADDILFQHVIYWRRLRWWLVGPKRKRV